MSETERKPQPMSDAEWDIRLQRGREGYLPKPRRVEAVPEAHVCENAKCGQDIPAGFVALALDYYLWDEKRRKKVFHPEKPIDYYCEACGKKNYPQIMRADLDRTQKELFRG